MLIYSAESHHRYFNTGNETGGADGI
jgi:hypothetical protein